MPVQHVPGSDLTYHLISYDKHGTERSDDPSGRVSELAASAVREQPITDVFVISHGWKGDVPAAIEQYDKWIGAMAGCEADRAAIRQRRPDFKPLIVGFHWPSLPWGDEEFGMGGGSFAVSGAGGVAAEPIEKALDRFVDLYADRIADTPGARAAIRTIVGQAMTAGPMTDALPPDVAAAYATLAAEADVRADGPAGDPGSDREPFDANRAYKNAKPKAGPGAGPSFGLPGFSGLLSPLRQLSFWKMKDRARALGETAGNRLLVSLMDAAPAGRTVRVHLMGHSFGCIVVSGMINGPNGAGGLPRAVDSVMLIQGATSLWGFCSDIPSANSPGYFRKIIEHGRVRGPIVTTQSKRDTAVGVLYPLAAGVAQQVAFAGPGQLPKYGGLGAFGIQGPGLTTHDLAIGDVSHAYGFSGGQVYNLEATTVIKDGGGASGAHSDIAKPEVAHAMWEAVKST